MFDIKSLPSPHLCSPAVGNANLVHALLSHRRAVGVGVAARLAVAEADAVAAFHLARVVVHAAEVALGAVGQFAADLSEGGKDNVVLVT